MYSFAKDRLAVTVGQISHDGLRHSVCLLVQTNERMANGRSNYRNGKPIVPKIPTFNRHLGCSFAPCRRAPRLSLARAAPPRSLAAPGSPPRPWRRRRHDDGGGRDSSGAVAPPPFCQPLWGVCVNGGVGSVLYRRGGGGVDGGDCADRAAPGASLCEAMPPRPRAVAVGWCTPAWPSWTAIAAGVFVGGGSGSLGT